MKRPKTSSRGLGCLFEKCDQGPRSHLFRNNRPASDFNVEVEGVHVEVIKNFNSRSSRLQAQVSNGFFGSLELVDSRKLWC